jgi:hypothetical protein
MAIERDLGNAIVSKVYREPAFQADEDERPGDRYLIITKIGL